MARGTIVALLLAAGLTTAEAQPNDAFSGLPRTERNGQQIGWYVNRTFDAFVKAVEEGKPLVIVFGSQDSGFTQGFARYVTPCPQLNQLAGAAVFAYGSPQVDERARLMASNLKLTDFPTISVIAPRTDKLVELHRLEGFFDAQSVANDVRDVLVQQKLWPQGRPMPKALPTHYLAYPNLICTPDGLEHYKLNAQGMLPR